MAPAHVKAQCPVTRNLARRLVGQLIKLLPLAESNKRVARLHHRQKIGQALFDAQTGGKHPNTKPLKGFGGAGVLEIVEDDRESTYRAVYTVKFAGVIYVLHSFQKKSKTGNKTPAKEIEKVKVRLKEAEKLYVEWLQEQEAEEQDQP